MKALKRHWRSALPAIRPLAEPRGTLPKASTFYAGAESLSGLHVFLYFQHSSKVPGRFTVNIVLAKDEHSPRHWGLADESTPAGGLGEGTHRIGRFVGTRRGDKWWMLKPDEFAQQFRKAIGKPEQREGDWYPTAYDDEPTVVRQAVDDVTRDIITVLRRLGIEIDNNQTGRPESC